MEYPFYICIFQIPEVGTIVSQGKMIGRDEKDRIKTLIADTVTLMCKNGLDYKFEFSVEALIGISLDRKEEFFISIKDGFQSKVPPPEEEAEVPGRRCSTSLTNTGSGNEASDDQIPHSRRTSGEYSESNTTADPKTAKQEILRDISLQDLDPLQENTADELWSSITDTQEAQTSSTDVTSRQKRKLSTVDSADSPAKRQQMDDEDSYSDFKSQAQQSHISVKQEAAEEEDQEEVVYIKDEPDSDHENDSSACSYNSQPVYRHHGHGSNNSMPSPGFMKQQHPMYPVGGGRAGGWPPQRMPAPGTPQQVRPFYFSAEQCRVWQYP